MSHPLLLSRRFLPLFIVQALGALNDNLFKNALVVLVAFRFGRDGPVLVALAGGLFILPYLLISATAGEWADRRDKSGLIRVAKMTELLLMVFAGVALVAGSTAALFAVLFGLGAQAAFFSPLKYGVLPELLGPCELLPANALVEAGTFVSILVGTIAGGALIGLGSGPVVVAACLIVLAVAGLLAAGAMPRLPAAAPTLPISRNPAAATLALLRAARARRPVWVAVLGLSWFWALGATFLAQFPVLAQAEFQADGGVVTLLLAGFSVGVGLGSMLVGRLPSEVAARSAPAALLLLSVSTIAFVGLASGSAASSWRSAAAMLGSVPGVAALLCLLVAAGSGGAFSVPLYAKLQTASVPSERARTVAANNVMNALFMVAGAAAIAGMAMAGLRPGSILLVAAGLNLVVAWWLRGAFERHAVREIHR